MTDDTEELAPEEEPAAETTEEAQGADTEETGQPEPEQAAEETEETDSEEDKPKKTESQKRRERKRQEVERLRASEEDGRRRLEAIKKAAQGEAEPKRDDFDDPDEYIAAKAAWNGTQAYQKRDESRVESELQEIARQRQAETAAIFAEQVALAKQNHKDFEEVAYSAPISDHVSEMLMASDYGAEIAYHLGLNRAEAVRISQMHPLDAARAIGRLETTVSAPKPKTKTTAPPPIKPVSGSGAVGNLDPEKMGYDEYRKARMSGQLR